MRGGWRTTVLDRAERGVPLLPSRRLLPLQDEIYASASIALSDYPQYDGTTYSYATIRTVPAATRHDAW